MWRLRIEENPASAGDVGPHLLLASAEVNRDNTQSALDEIAMAEELDPDLGNAINLSYATYLYGRIGRLDDARRLFTRVSRVNER